VAEYGHEFVGWHGPVERDTRPLGVPEVRGILPRGGTILGSSRTNPFKEDRGPERIFGSGPAVTEPEDSGVPEPLDEG
jgi:hypothetical protein